MLDVKGLAIAAAVTMLGAGVAEARCPLEGVTVFCDEPATSGRYVQKPGCCANAPRPTAQYGTRRYHYGNGREVVVYGAGRGLGRQEFWWWAVPPQ
jgi:hypothetical protein